MRLTCGLNGVETAQSVLGTGNLIIIDKYVVVSGESVVTGLVCVLVIWRLLVVAQYNGPLCTALYT